MGIIWHMTRTRSVVLVLAIAHSACVSAGGGRTTPRPLPTTTTGVVLNTGGPWTLGVPARSEKVLITTEATVVIAGDTTVRTDTVHATLAASYTWTGSAPRKVDGQLTDYRVAVGAAVPAAPPGLQFARPFSATATPTASALVFTLPAEATACTDPALSSVQGLQDAWVAVPARLTVGQQWTDTVTTLSCRDRVPLHGISVRRFVVKRGEVEDGKRVLVVIERTARGRLTGEGDQFGEKLTISGESNGIMLYLLDPVAGHFVRASGGSSLSFTFRSSRRNQRVRQSSVLTLTW